MKIIIQIPSSIYCTYDKEGKLIGYYTDQVRDNSEDGYIWENTVIEYNTNPDCSNTCVIISNEDETTKEVSDENEDNKRKK